MYRKGQKTITNVYEEVRAAPCLTVTPACIYLHHSSLRSVRSMGHLGRAKRALCTNAGGAAVQEPQRPVGGVHLLPARLHATIAAGPMLCTTAACRSCVSMLAAPLVSLPLMPCTVYCRVPSARWAAASPTAAWAQSALAATRPSARHAVARTQTMQVGCGSADRGRLALIVSQTSQEVWTDESSWRMVIPMADGPFTHLLQRRRASQGRTWPRSCTSSRR